MKLMKSKSILQAAVLALLTVSLVGCDSIPFMNDEPDYKGAGRSRPLEVPPDLTASPVSEAYSIPGSTTYSSYSDSQQVPGSGEPKVLATPDNVKMIKAGGQRWLEVNAPAEKVWPVIREFWNDQGFAVRSEDPQIGVMETEWINTDSIKEDTSGNYGERFDRWLDRLSGLTDKKKFKTRIERGETANITEIYMTHRSVSGAPDDGKNRVQTQLGEIDTGYKRDSDIKKPSQTALDAELDAELLRRLMVKLGVEDKKSHNVLANIEVQKRAEVIKAADGSATLKLTDTYDRAWRRVGLAIDRVGFVMEDKDRIEGIFFVRYADVDIDYGPAKKKKGLLESLKFWGDDDDEDASEDKKETSMVDKLKFWGKKDETAQKEGQYRIKVAQSGEKVALVNVVNEQGAVVKTRTANRIVALIYEQLR